MARVHLKKRKFEMPSKYILLILTAVCIALMLLTFTTDAVSGPLSGVAGYTVIPFQNGMTAAGTWVNDRLQDIRSVKAVLSENSALKDQVAELEQKNNQLVEDRYELSNLRDLYSLDKEYSEYEKIGAHVTGKDPGNWYSVFVVDKGSNDGIEENMNVIAGSGLVGIVTKVGPNWAQVRSIIDDDSNVSGMVLSSSDNLMVNGNLKQMESGDIDFAQLNDSADKVAVGDKVVTSNISDRYLPGISIGYINSIEKDANNLTKSGTITPAVDFEHIDVVLIIKQLKETT